MRIINCEFCNKETKRKRFCSYKCFWNWKKGKTNTEIFGEKLAIEIHNKQSASETGNPSKLKGRTYEEIHGKEKAEELKKKRSISSSHPSPLKGKTYEEICGEKRGKELREIRSANMLGNPRWGESKKTIICKICGVEFKARAYGMHKKIHLNGHDIRNKCVRDGCNNLVKNWHFKYCSRDCVMIVAFKADKGRNRHSVSKPQKHLFEIVKSYGGLVELNYPLNTGVSTRFLDVAMLDNRIDFEYDSEYWHRGREEADTQRDKDIINAGWKIVHIREREDMQKIIGNYFESNKTESCCNANKIAFCSSEERG